MTWNNITDCAPKISKENIVKLSVLIVAYMLVDAYNNISMS